MVVVDASLEYIIKNITTIYGSVKSFDLLMRNFYRADQEEEESILPFPNRIEG